MNPDGLIVKFRTDLKISMERERREMIEKIKRLEEENNQLNKKYEEIKKVLDSINNITTIKK